MLLNEYQERAAATDDFARVPEGMDGLRVLLLGVVGEAGSAASEAKKSYRDVSKSPELEEAPAWLADHICQELGDRLWYMAAVARRLGRDLDTIAAENLVKVVELWAEELPPVSMFDDRLPEEQSLPRRFTVRFSEDASGVGTVRMHSHDDALRRRLERFRGVFAGSRSRSSRRTRSVTSSTTTPTTTSDTDSTTSSTWRPHDQRVGGAPQPVGLIARPLALQGPACGHASVEIHGQHAIRSGVEQQHRVRRVCERGGVRPRVGRHDPEACPVGGEG